MFGRKNQSKFSVNFTFDKTQMTNLYTFATLRLEDEFFTLDWASGRVAQVNYKDIASASVVRHGFYTFIEIKANGFDVFITGSKNKQILTRLNEKCGGRFLVE